MVVMDEGTGEIGITETAAAIGTAAPPRQGGGSETCPSPPAKPFSEVLHSAPGGRRGADRSGE